MLDSIGSPGHHVGSCCWHRKVRAHISVLLRTSGANILRDLVCLSLNVLLQDLDLSDLWVSMVHHLIEELVSDYEIVPETLVLELLEVALEYVSNLVEESEHHGDIGISFGHTHHVNVVNFYPDVSDVFFCEHGLDQSLVQLEHFSLEFVGDGSTTLATVVAGDYDLTLLVEEINCRNTLSTHF